MSGEGDGEEELYDEFGNYIGPDLDDDDSASSSDEDDGDSASKERGRGDEDGSASDVSDDNDDDNDDNAMVVRDDSNNNAAMTAEPMQAIVLHEDKEHYPSAEQVYGDDVRTAVLDEDTMDLDTPLVKPVVTKSNRASASTGDAGGGGGGNNNKATMTIEESDWLFGDDYLGVHVSNETTRTRRGVAVVGHLHHGKTTLLDLLLSQVVGKPWGPRAALDTHAGGGPRYTDTLRQEELRQMSLASTPVTVLLPDTRGKSYCITALDCPGHANFHGSSVASLAAADGAVVCVDAVEGIMLHTEMVLRAAVSAGLPVCLVITKMDRLIVELKLPPADAYFKLLSVVDSVNEFIGHATAGRYPKLSPAAGNVAFSSAQHGWLFTLESFAQVYVDHCPSDDNGGGECGEWLGENLSVEGFAKRLWGDVYLDPVKRTFHSSPRDCQDPSSVRRTFCTYVLEPLYKIYSACLGEGEKDVNQLLRSVGVLLRKEQLRASARPLLRAALSQFFQTAVRGFVDMIVRHVPCPAVAARGKLVRSYTGGLPPPSRKSGGGSGGGSGDTTKTNKDDEGKSWVVTRAMMKCDPNGPLVMHAVQLIPTPDGQEFWTLCRIYSGTVRPITTVRVLGESYHPTQNPEDVATAVVQDVAIPRGRTHTVVNMCKAGNWVLVKGIDATIAKTATIVGVSAAGNSNNNPRGEGEGEGGEEEVHIFAPLQFSAAGGEPVVKLAIEPLNPAQLPNMVEGLRRVSKAYPMVRTKVEESGEHVLLGTGELFLDCVMHDLRHVYSDNLEVKVADPMVSFRETVIESSTVKCFSPTANGRNKLTCIAEPLEEGLAERLQAGKIRIDEWDDKKLGRYFESNYHWNPLDSRSIWALGDSPSTGTNILVNDTLPNEVDPALLRTCRGSIVQGFRWAAREGPLAEEPVRSCKVKLLEAVLADQAVHRGGGQVIPAARKTIHSALLTANPRFMEPIYRLQITCPAAAAAATGAGSAERGGDNAGNNNQEVLMNAISSLLTRRRGHIVQDALIPGTTLCSVKGFVPALDSFGLETDIRTMTQGRAMVFSVFDHWWVVPGDPLDSSVVLHPLEPSRPAALARELLVKTRRRKGLSEDVAVSKFLNDEMKRQLFSE